MLSGLPRVRLAGGTLWRVFQRHRDNPWFFAAVDELRPHLSGRFALPAPYGACSLATSKTAAILEAFQEYSDGVIPLSALRRRMVARISAPASAPAAVQLTAARARGVGVTAALWAGGDRVCTQQWALTLHRAGWRALYGGVAQDPAGRLRAVTLFDRSGQHVPYDDEAWQAAVEPADTPDVRAALGGYGIRVTRSDPDLPFIELDASGLKGQP